jgi:hypothetical protein
MRRLTELAEGFQRQGLRVRRGTVIRALLELPTEREMVLRVLLAEETTLVDPDPGDDRVGVYPTTDVPPRLIEKLDRVAAGLLQAGCRKKHSGIIRALLASMPPAERWQEAMRRFLTEHPRRKRARGKPRARLDDAPG